MKIAVVRFPGSNCDQDAYHALADEMGVTAEYVWHDEMSLSRFDGVFVPGGFSYGDYLRCGAMAANSPVMAAVRDLANAGQPVLGACNGFQILCEAGILPGALLENSGQKFICDRVALAPVNRTSAWTEECPDVLIIPVAHREGRYVCDAETLRELEQEDRIAFRYVHSEPPHAPLDLNGSQESIAGVLNSRGNVLGMMPHPERAARAELGGTDGLAILRGFTALVGLKR